MYNLASNYTLCAANTTTTIVNGSSFWCYGFVFTAATGSTTATVYESDGTTVIMTVKFVANNTSHDINIPFIADNGMIVSLPSGVTCTVFHANGGG